MSRWGKASQERLKQLDPRLVEVMEFLRDFRDITIVCTHRSPADQLKAFASGHSQVRVGKHNSLPSKAVDFTLYPQPVKEADLREGLTFLAGAALAYGVLRGYRLRWGGDWNKNWNTSDNTFDDLFHIEIMEEPL